MGIYQNEFIKRTVDLSKQVIDSDDIFEHQISMLIETLGQRERELKSQLNKMQFVLSDVLKNADYDAQQIVKSIDRHEKLFELNNGFITRDEFDLWHRVQSSKCNDSLSDGEFWGIE